MDKIVQCVMSGLYDFVQPPGAAISLVPTITNFSHQAESAAIISGGKLPKHGSSQEKSILCSKGVDSIL